MVEWKQMWEVTTWDKRFTGVDKYMQPKVIKYHYYLANELTELERKNGDVRILYTTDKVAFTYSSDVEGTISEGEIVAIPWGGNVSIKYFKGRFITADNRIATSNDNLILNNKFLFYWMLSQKDEIGKFYRGAGIQHPSMFKVLTMPIPIPSLSEQTRIVEILDTFTAVIENLKQQIAERRKQYEHYRDELLDLEGKEGVEMKKISEVAKNYTGLTYKPENVSETGTLVLRSSNIDEDSLVFNDNVFVQMEISERAKAKENDILICVRNGSKRLVGKAAVINRESDGMAFGAFMTVLRAFAINYKYLFFVWQSDKVKVQYKGDEAMPIAQITSKDFQRIVIPVPSPKEQSRIVSILDTFEASIANLEAQLKKREKQYEYYRNKLLTFE